MSIFKRLISKISKTFFFKESFTNFIYGYNIKEENNHKVIEKKTIRSVTSKKVPLFLKTNKKVIKKGAEKPFLTIKQSQEKLEKTIKKNIFYLIQLKEAFIKNNLEPTYIKKIQDLIVQSEGNIKIMYRLNIEAIYYNTTIGMIKNHTKIVQELISEAMF